MKIENEKTQKGQFEIITKWKTHTINLDQRHITSIKHTSNKHAFYSSPSQNKLF